MNYRSVMLKPVSGLCNMRCAYCFYTDLMEQRATPDYGRMSLDTAYQIIDNTLSGLSAGGKAVIAFQGGEPTLAGLDFFRAIFAYGEGRGVTVEYALQTNGLLLDENWCELLRRYKVLVGLSLDGEASLHDMTRKDVRDSGTFSRVMRTKRLLDRHKVPYNILSVLTRQAARHPRRAWNFLVRENVGYVQFIPCLGPLEGKTDSPYTLTPESFYQFYSGLFPLWADTLRKGRFISVKLFDDLMNYYGLGLPTSCGINGRCGLQFAVESDGSVFPCDFYMLDEYRLGSLTGETLAELTAHGAKFLRGGRPRNGEEPCKSCRYVQSCGGGCRRMRDNVYISGEICYYARLLDEILGPLLQILAANRPI